MGHELVPASQLPTTENTTTTTALAPGFRFHPTDEELVSYYLKRKVCGKPFRFNAISDVDIYKSEPWDLPGKARLKSRDQEWYFFSALDKKYGNGARMNRATSRGYWKATGKDRAVNHNNRLLGMKKTLVFHNGRAPDGKRTDWVMHEYRLVDEELDKPGVTQFAYVLCRVFQKNGLGPPNGNRYAPFIEEEWDDGELTLVPGEEAGDEGVAGDDTFYEGNNPHQDNESTRKPPLGGNQLSHPIKSEMLDDPSFPCVVSREEPFPILQYKRRRGNEDCNRSNGSENSSGTNQDHCSSMTTTGATTRTTTPNLPYAPLEYSPPEPFEPKGLLVPALRPDPSLVDAPTCCVKYINRLQNEIHKINIERETMKLEMMSAQVMLNILQSRIEHLSNENENLRRNVHDA